MNDLQQKFLEQVLKWMEQDNKTFSDVVITIDNATLTYSEFFDQIINNEGYGARCLTAYNKVKKP